uniref:Putative secreted protein n=1 Tax=Ixodes ricinus TaxID=34613 RepID=V5GHS4_IXORI
MKTLCSALASTVVVTALLAEVTAVPGGQQPMWPIGVPAPRPGKKGDPCITAASCSKGTCCLKQPNNSSRTCLAFRAIRTSVFGKAEIKGGVYIGHCPCETDLRCREFFARTHIFVCEES